MYSTKTTYTGVKSLTKLNNSWWQISSKAREPTTAGLSIDSLTNYLQINKQVGGR